ncbi:TPA: DUF3613 domain-containing protein [Burkholderia multivorans]|uniref:DUF3613 domain-containing protein n=1 Tax=Burkholderia multivorans TaxID=87883 RepID=UPI000D0118C8|nr:DUF3613 domain-containing protein [Burkholderia multivorans]MBU9296898.1 DUF3613 domain-containing protein [Burkholderia multivorans]MBU9302577.1 DUF3613 domain-containing protein [Burkholderia multivorans]MBU9406641.1 DUF3613 domain-containing protein [Burkholderia multivorans]MBU9500259.1 DUF3613 domain-containing protein [Burkholderia multivorans]MBU9506573.1 DUF3613 domain-containing protein [Burkholderia multivorans]
MNGNKRQRNGWAARIALAGAIAWAAAGAGVARAQATATASDVGRSTTEWLSMQRDNRAAAPTQPLLGDVASLVYQRYLESFKHKIPESMGTQVGAAGMSGGGQNAQ